METSTSSVGIDRGSIPESDRWASLARYRHSAFTAAGLLVLASLLVPVGLGPIIDRAWLAGLLLVGLGVSSAAIGVLGLYPTLEAQSPKLAVAGSLAAAVAGSSAAILVGTSVLAVGWIWVSGDIPAVPMAYFIGTAALLALGYGIGFLLAGFGARSSETLAASTGWFLLVGGSALLVSAAGVLSSAIVGIGLPPWTAFPSIVVTGLATIGTGVSIRPRGPSREASEG